MNSLGKVTVYTPNPETNIPVSGNKGFIITRTKLDELLNPFISSDSFSSSLAQCIAESDILTAVLFLQGKKNPQLDSRFPIAQDLPLILNPNYGLEKLLEGPYKNKTDETKEKYEKANKSYMESFNP